MRIWKKLMCLALSGAMCLGLLAGCAGEGDGVSLSPASASFDLYPGFEARGRHFKELVSRL